MNAYNQLQNELEQGILSEELQTKQPQGVITTTAGSATEIERDTKAEVDVDISVNAETETEKIAQFVFATAPNMAVRMEMHSEEIQTEFASSGCALTPISIPFSIPMPAPIHLPSNESTIIDIPSSSAAASSSSSYDTDSSTASSTCCTRHGEHIYMERNVILQQQLQHHHQHQHQHQHHQHVARTTSSSLSSSSSSPPPPASSSSSSSSSLPDVSSSTPASFKSKSKHSYQKSWPIFILLISIVEISIFAYDQLTYKRRRIDLPTTLHIPTNSVFIYRPDRRLQIWRFVSYMFLHANWFHLGFNVVIQLFYGVPLEVMHGSIRVCIIYLAGVFAGSLGTSVVDSDVYLVGASGGVYALLAAHLANLMLNYAQMKYAVAQLVSVIIFVFCDLGYTFYTQYLDVIEPNAAPPVSYIAHLTGALAGLTIGLLVLKNFEQRAYENIIWYLALGVYSAFTIFAIAFNLANTVTAQRMEEQGEVITQHLLHDLGVS